MQKGQTCQEVSASGQEVSVSGLISVELTELGLHPPEHVSLWFCVLIRAD